MKALLAAAIAAQAALLMAVWLRHPWTLYLQPLPGILLVAWLLIRGHKARREYRALLARHKAHERELMAMLDGHVLANDAQPSPRRTT